ncbi:Expansin-like A1, partial [Bienertia sinuspersici]
MVAFSHFIFIILIIAYALAYNRYVHQSKAAYYYAGACGYGSLALNFNGGFLAARVSSCFKDGAGYGACFQIWCKNSDLCSKSGTKVMLMDLNTNTDTDFVLSNKAFKDMAKRGKDRDILKLVTTDMDYK